MAMLNKQMVVNNFKDLFSLKKLKARLSSCEKSPQEYCFHALAPSSFGEDRGTSSGQITTG